MVQRLFARSPATEAVVTGGLAGTPALRSLVLLVLALSLHVTMLLGGNPLAPAPHPQPPGPPAVQAAWLSVEHGQGATLPHAMLSTCVVVLTLLAVQRLLSAVRRGHTVGVQRPLVVVLREALQRAALPRGPTRIDAGVVLRI